MLFSFSESRINKDEGTFDSAHPGQPWGHNDLGLVLLYL